MGVMMETVSLSVSCTHCGHARIGVDDQRDDNSPAWCMSCAAPLGSWGEVKEQARAAVFDALRGDFDEILKLAANAKASPQRRTPAFAVAA